MFFAFSAALVACGSDSSTSADSSDVPSSGRGNGGQHNSTPYDTTKFIPNGCNFDMNSDTWFYAFPGLDDFGSYYGVTYNISGSDVFVSEVGVNTGELAQMYCKFTGDEKDVQDLKGDGTLIETTFCQGLNMIILDDTTKAGYLDGVVNTRESMYKEVLRECKRLNNLPIDEEPDSSASIEPSSQGAIFPTSSDSAEPTSSSELDNAAEPTSSSELDNAAEPTSSDAVPPTSSDAEPESSEDAEPESSFSYDPYPGCDFVETDDVWAYTYKYVGVNTQVRYEWIDETTVSYIKKQTSFDSPSKRSNVNRAELFEEAMTSCLYYMPKNEN